MIFGGTENDTLNLLDSTQVAGKILHYYDGVFQVDESSIELQNGIKSTQEKSSKVAHRWNGKQFIPGNSQTATAELFKPARGDEWRVNRLPGAAPSATSEQVVLQVMRRTATGFEEVTRLEESLQTEPKTGVKRRTRVEFSIDESGVFQARQTISVKQGPKPEKTEKVMVLKWDGKALTPARGR